MHCFSAVSVVLSDKLLASKFFDSLQGFLSVSAACGSFSPFFCPPLHPQTNQWLKVMVFGLWFLNRKNLASLAWGVSFRSPRSLKLQFWVFFVLVLRVYSSLKRSPRSSCRQQERRPWFEMSNAAADLCLKYETCEFTWLPNLWCVTPGLWEHCSQTLYLYRLVVLCTSPFVSNKWKDRC